MSEPRKLWIEGPVGRLEAVLRVAREPKGAALVCHPHPVHGGTLHNAVVFHADRELHRSGWTTLRFNFRGVEGSDGEHDEGRGEVDDVAAATAWLRGVSGGAPLFVVGYSFGSWCGLRHAVGNDNVAGFVGIGLPVRIYNLDRAVREFGRPLAVVHGQLDEFGSLTEVQDVLDGANPPGKLYPVEGAEHLFPEQAREAGRLASEAANALLGG